MTLSMTVLVRAYANGVQQFNFCQRFSGYKQGNREHPYHVFVIGRGDKIRTCDPLHPMQVRYQAAPRPDRKVNDS